VTYFKSASSLGTARMMPRHSSTGYSLASTAAAWSSGICGGQSDNELITRPRSPADCPRSSNRNETESFMEASKAQNCAVDPQGKNSTCLKFPLK
jgi:hypothetical protein